MTSYIGVYLHGFLSSGKSLKGQWLQQKVRSTQSGGIENKLVELLTPTYPVKSPYASATLIDELIQTQLADLKNTGNKLILIGSSMGGFYAQFFAKKFQLPYVLINPALNPIPLFQKHLGEHTNPNTNETVVIDMPYLQQLAGYEVDYKTIYSPVLLLLDKDDEVIDVNHIKNNFIGSISTQSFLQKTVIYSGGDHSFIHMDDAWLQISSFLEQIEV